MVEDLHDVARVLSEFVTGELGYSDVQAGPPRPATATASPAVRFTLLYTTPQPTHRNDGWQRNPDGSERPPPLSLSCFYVVTASGTSDEDPIGAHNALGKVMQLFHDHSELSLPLSGGPQSSPPNGYSVIGAGPLGVVQVPMSLELIDKIWSSLEEQLQPWALFEVSPVQLPSLRADAPPSALVRPGGVRLGDVRASRRPSIERVEPNPLAAGGRVRIDVSTPAFDALIVGGIEVLSNDASLSHIPGSNALLLTLDDGGLDQLGPGAHPVVLRSGGMLSTSATLRVSAPGVPVLEAPTVVRHDPNAPLTLRGTNLAGAVDALVWPDRGVAAPSDVHTLALSAVGANAATIAAAGTPGGLGDVAFGAEPWRVALRVGDHVYTPYVVLEFGS
jgi:hypothetical protein